MKNFFVFGILIFGLQAQAKTQIFSWDTAKLDNPDGTLSNQIDPEVTGYRIGYQMFRPGEPCVPFGKIRYWIDAGNTTEILLSAEPIFQVGASYFLTIVAYKDKQYKKGQAPNQNPPAGPNPTPNNNCPADNEIKNKDGSEWANIQSETAKGVCTTIWGAPQERSNPENPAGAQGASAAVGGSSDDETEVIAFGPVPLEEELLGSAIAHSLKSVDEARPSEESYFPFLGRAIVADADAAPAIPKNNSNGNGIFAKAAEIKNVIKAVVSRNENVVKPAKSKLNQPMTAGFPAENNFADWFSLGMMFIAMLSMVFSKKTMAVFVDPRVRHSWR